MPSFSSLTARLFTLVSYRSMIVCGCLSLTAAGLFFIGNIAFTSASAPSGLDYFKGGWTVALRGDPAQKFSWTVKEDLNKSWLSGVVEQNGQRVSTDFWRLNGQRIERFAFTGNSVFVRLESSGWEGDKMILTGTMSDRAGETKVREMITKISEKEFNAIWEMQAADGKWTVFGDEICTKN